MSDYETDIVLWSEHQADLLRRLAAGGPMNEAPDWPNIAEEIESVGSEQRHAVESLLLLALIHMSHGPTEFPRRRFRAATTLNSFWPG